MIRITLKEADYAAVWQLLSAHTNAEIAADCEPSGWEFAIGVVPGVETNASLRIGPANYDLGEAVFSDGEGIAHDA